MSKPGTITFEVKDVRGETRKHEKSTFLGYVDGTLRIAGILNGSDLVLGTRNGIASVVNGRFRFDFAEKSVEDEESDETRWVPAAVYPLSRETRVAITNAVRKGLVEYRAVKREEEDDLAAIGAGS